MIVNLLLVYRSVGYLVCGVYIVAGWLKTSRKRDGSKWFLAISSGKGGLMGGG